MQTLISIRTEKLRNSVQRRQSAFENDQLQTQNDFMKSKAMMMTSTNPFFSAAAAGINLNPRGEGPQIHQGHGRNIKADRLL